MNPINTSALLNNLVNQVESNGLTLSLSHEQRELVAAAKALNGKHLSVFFDPSYVELVPDRLIWIKATDSDGELAGVSATRLDDLGRSSLSHFLRPLMERRYEASNPNAPCHALHEMKGRCAYHGETWISSKWRGFGLGPDFAKILLLCCMSAWQPDYSYAFFEDHVQYSGFSSRTWFQRTERVGQHFKTWLKPTDFIAWMSYEDLINLVELECPRNGLTQLQR